VSRRTRNKTDRERARVHHISLYTHGMYVFRSIPVQNQSTSPGYGVALSDRRSLVFMRVVCERGERLGEGGREGGRERDRERARE
jgi:hypothetical protein